MSKPHTVIVILDAKPEHEKDLEVALEEVAKHSRAEKACIEYRIYKSKNNAHQFVLYENWESDQKHAEQFSKTYIKEFADKAKDFLAGPYQVVFAAEI